MDKKYGNTDCMTTRDFRQVVERKDIDAIMTATPDQWHALIGIAAAKAGKHVHSQKPLGYSIPEGRAIVNAVKKYGIVWQTGKPAAIGREVSSGLRAGPQRRHW